MLIPRRKAAAAIALAAAGLVRGQNKSKKPAPAVTVETWMKTWMDAEGARQPVGSLYLGRFADPIYFLTKPITWKPNKGQEKYREVTVPTGFVTDLTSIPRAFWSLLRPDGQYVYAAIVHDYLYWFQERSREESDMILKLGMQDFAVAQSTVYSIYQAVNLAGDPSWRENARLRKAGEKRVLKRIPDDPRTTWAEWKRDSENFQ